MNRNQVWYTGAVRIIDGKLICFIITASCSKCNARRLILSIEWVVYCILVLTGYDFSYFCFYATKHLYDHLVFQVLGAILDYEWIDIKG